MTELLKSDIFFVISTISTGLVTIGILVALYYFIRILRDLKFISNKLKEEGDKIIDDVRLVREEAENAGYKIFKFLYSLIGLGIESKRKKVKKEN